MSGHGPLISYYSEYGADIQLNFHYKDHICLIMIRISNFLKHSTLDYRIDFDYIQK